MSTIQTMAPADPGIVDRLEDGAVIPLPSLGLLQVTGDDARSFLQAQLTQDIGSASNSRWTLAGYCNPKGRLFGLFTVIQSDVGFLLVTRRALLEGLLKRLRMFVLRSKVTIEDVSDDYSCLGVLGDGPIQRLQETTGSIPDEPFSLHQAGDLLVLNQPGELPRHLLITPVDQGAALQQTIRGDADAVGEALWWLTEIRAGIPLVTEQTTESFVPQQVNLELIGGVNFKKGCYPGQEIVARMHYLGKPSRRMYRMLAPLASDLPEPGDKITDGEGKSAGEIVIAAPGPDGAELLAVLKTAFQDRQDLRVGDAPAEIAALPYDLEG